MSFRSTAILAVGRTGILPVLSELGSGRQDARRPHRLEACATSPGAVEQVADFLIARLAEIVIELADGLKIFWRNCADRFVDFSFQFTARFRSSYWNRNDYSSGAALTKRSDCCAHGRTRRQTVVHQNRHLILHIGRWTIISIQLLSPLEFNLFPGSGDIDYFVGVRQLPDDVVIEDAHAT